MLSHPLPSWAPHKTHKDPSDEGEVIGFCREKIAKYKIPKSIQFVEKLPKTAGGKIRKYLLK